MNRIKLLFVDDDPNILAGLKRLTRTRRDEWQTFFCEAAEEALALMTTQPIDVVVSDMRMPIMDGAEFLARVRKLHPATIRVILSGYADAECILRTVGPAHIYLAKPCQPDQLLEAIARPLALRQQLASEGLQAALAGLTNLPSAPQLFLQLQAELGSPTVSAARVAQIVSADVAMTAELLKLTNSAYFSNASRVTSTLQAVRTLGLDTVETLVLRTGIFRQLSHGEQLAAMIEALNGYSLDVASLAEKIACAEGADPSVAKAAYCAGMLSAIGALVLLDGNPQRYGQVVAAVRSGQALHEAEEAAFGASHAIVGGYLLSLWGFADPVVEAVTHACRPSASGIIDNPLLTAVHAAITLIGKNPLITDLPGLKLDMSYICDARKDLSLSRWRELAQAQLRETAHA